MTRGRSILRRTARALPLAAVFVLLTAAAAFADIQVTANAPPASAKCSLTSPSAQCGQWTYWASLGALVIGLFVVISFVVRYLKDAPKFQMEADGKATPARAQAAVSARPLAPPPPGAAPAPAAAPVPAPAAEAAPAAGSVAVATAVAVADPPAAAADGGGGGEPAAAAGPVATRPPSPRHEPVEPDQATYERTLAEQLAKGTDRRVAEGRAKAAALKAAREQAGT